MQQKLITFAVPCYNSAAYMRHCIETLLSAGEQAEIILVDDGSVKDETPAICDEYAAKYPTIVKAIHQENGGHGEGVNQGIRNATGLYYKVVDSDDWLDTDALKKVLSRLHTLVTRGTAPDLMICNYVYEHTEDGTSHTVRYTNIFPQERLFTWMHVGHFRPDQNLLMHSVMYRTEVLRKCGMVLPKHTFYVDNIFVYQPLPFVKTMYYMDLDLYRYFIGRADQSVNESIMVKRVDQQLRVTKHMIDCQDLDALKGEKKLRAYMLHYLSMMMAVSDIFLLLDGSAEAKEKQKGLWQYLREHTASAAALFFCPFRPFVKESSILPHEKMLLFRKWNSIIYYCAVFFGLLASSKETRLTEKKEERAAARRYRAAARNIAWNSFSSAFPWPSCC